MDICDEDLHEDEPIEFSLVEILYKCRKCCREKIQYNDVGSGG